MTDDDIRILSDSTKSANELAEHFGVAPITIFRWRKKLGVKITAGSKKGKLKPWLNKERILCECSYCGKTIERLPKQLEGVNRIFCSKECIHDSGYLSQISKQTDRSYMKTEEYSRAKQKPDTPKYIRFRNRVSRLTEQVYENNVDKINPNGYKRTLAGVEGGYHLDHIVSVRYAFDNNIPIEEICKVENLQMLPWKENITKGKLC